MRKREVAVAGVSADAAAAGARTAEEGGNAVDAALAAALASVVTHPAMCSLGGGGYIVIWPAGGEPEVVDGGHEMPGRGLPPERLGRGLEEVSLEYGGGVVTAVGPGSVATPGLLAACALAAERHARLPWRDLVEPAFERARDGFPMPASSHGYLIHSHERIFARDPRSRAALHDREGRLLEPGQTIRVEGLADTLRAIADEGVEVFYRGDLGRRVVAHLREGGGILTRRDLESYRAEVRRPLTSSVDGWRLATNPPPAVGGATLTAMLILLGPHPREGWSAEEVGRLAEVQRAVLAYRWARLDGSADLEVEVRGLLELARRGERERLLELARATPRKFPEGAAGPAPSGHAWDAEPGVEEAPRPESRSTLHTSAVDSEGNACAITLSDGYGSGIVPPGTGLWLNNCLGERELNRRGYHALAPGTRLPSNMAPTVARSPDGGSLAIGSPGADRITTAILQVLLNRLRLGMSLTGAIEAPRLHVERTAAGARAACEPGLPLAELTMPIRRFDAPSMFFGGVTAAAWTPEAGFEAGADPRRIGGVAIGGGGRS